MNNSLIELHQPPFCQCNVVGSPSSVVYNMDCVEGMKHYPDKYFDLAICDPPYGIDINSSSRLGHYGGKKNWDNTVPLIEYFIELFRVSKNQIIWGGNYFDLPPTRCFLIWDKQQPEDVSFASCEYAWTSFNQSAKTFYMRPQNADNTIYKTDIVQYLRMDFLLILSYKKNICLFLKLFKSKKQSKNSKFYKGVVFHLLQKE